MPTTDSASSWNSRSETNAIAFDNMMPLAPILLVVAVAAVFIIVVVVLIASRRRNGTAGGGAAQLFTSSRADLVSTVRVTVAPDGFWLRSAAVAAEIGRAHV